MDFESKGEGRIYVKTEEEKEKILRIIREMDSCEFDNYFPDNLVAVYPGKDEWMGVVYNGKFSLDFEWFFEKCREEGIKAVILRAPQKWDDYPYPLNPYTIHRSWIDLFKVNVFGDKVEDKNNA